MSVENTIERITDALKIVKGVEAFVLGGSRARGSFTPKSDIDIGIYYSDGSELDIYTLRSVAAELDDEHRSDLITEIGGWGPWINGGGWLIIDGIPTDFLFKDVKRISSVIDDCLNGNITIDYQAGHPHGFVNAIYAAETFYCKILHDPKGIISNFKSKVTPYPESIKAGIINKFLWEARFSLMIAGKSVTRQDAAYVSGCFFRAYACLVQVLCALNKVYIMNEKGALDIVDTLEKTPADFKIRVNDIFSSLNTEPENIKNLIDKLTVIVEETEELCSDSI